MLGGLWVMLVTSLAVAWALRPVEEPILQLRAPRDTSAELPVYAQFAVRQTFRVPDSPAALVLVVPMVLHAPFGRTVDFQATVERGGNVGPRNTFPVTERAKNLRVPVPQTLGETPEVTLLLAAPTVRRPADAPRVFYEPEEQAYPSGELSVAGRAKPGNIALRVSARTPQIILFWRRLRADPRHLAGALQRLTFLLLLLFLPFVLGHRYVQAEEEAEDRNHRPAVDDH